MSAFVFLWSISCIPAVFSGAAADHTTSSPMPGNGIAGHILHGIGGTTQDPKATVSVPQASIIWQDTFPKASIRHAQSCWSAYTNWFASYPSYYATASPSLSSSATYTLSTVSYSSSSTIWPSGNISTITLCDGNPRALARPSTYHFETSTIMNLTSYSTTYPEPIPEQACTLEQADCAVLYFGTNLQSLSSDIFANEWAMNRLLGACGYPLDAEVPCLVQGGPVEVMYFPVSTTGGDLVGCVEGTTITPAEEPAPVTTLGMTFHPDKVYVSFETLYAAYRSLNGPGGAAVQIGKGYSNEIFEFRSDEISTNCFATSFSIEGGHNPGYGPGTQLNYADLNYPPPATAYQCQNQCTSTSSEVSPDGMNVTIYTLLPNPCETIWDNFNPLIAVPTRLKSMHPEWASCRFWNYRQANIVFDPPIALTQAAAVAKPTLPVGYLTTGDAAMPANTGERPASRTYAAGADHLPSATPTTAPGIGEGGAEGSSNGNSKAAAASLLAFTPVASQDGTNAGTTSTSVKQVLAAGDVTVTAIVVSGATDAVEVQGSTVSANGPAVTVGGGVLSMGTDGLVAIQTATATATPLSSNTDQATEGRESSSHNTASVASESIASFSGNSFLDGNFGAMVFVIALLLLLLV